MSILHLRLTEPQSGRWQFRVWTDNENTATPRDLALSEIADLEQWRFDNAGPAQHTPVH